MRRPVHCAAIAGLVLLIAACGGGGGSSSSSGNNLVSAPSTPAVSLSTTGLAVGFQGQPYGDTLFAASGKAPYTYSAQGLPPGITLVNQGVQGNLSGTPTQTGSFPVTITVTDSSSPPTTASRQLNLSILSIQTVRNDTLANANVLACCGTIRASFSPYSKASGVAAPDQDLYRFTANPGDRISVDAVAIFTQVDTDTYLQILDVNGAVMTSCKTPTFASSFSQACVNDDINPGVIRNSHLDVQLPQTSGVFIVRVLDLYGRARPEMTYELRTVKLP